MIVYNVFKDIGLVRPVNTVKIKKYCLVWIDMGYKPNTIYTRISEMKDIYLKRSFKGLKIPFRVINVAKSLVSLIKNHKIENIG